MSANGHAEPSETSPLLSSVVPKAALGGLPEASDGPLQPHVNDTNGDEENGAVEEVNPLHRGLPEVYARMHWLLPSVAIGVSVSSHRKDWRELINRVPKRSFLALQIKLSSFLVTGGLGMTSRL